MENNKVGNINSASNINSANFLSRPEWRRDAACADDDVYVDMFYPEVGGAAMANAARRLCVTCPVATECLKEAYLHDDENGIWGGLNAKERRASRTYFETTNFSSEALRAVIQQRLRRPLSQDKDTRRY